MQDRVSIPKVYIIKQAITHQNCAQLSTGERERRGSLRTVVRKKWGGLLPTPERRHWWDAAQNLPVTSVEQRSGTPQRKWCSRVNQMPSSRIVQ